MSLSDVIELVSTRGTDVAASRVGADATAARQIDAGRLPNPELSLTAEDFGGQGARRGFTTAQTTLQLSQAIPLTRRLGHEEAVARGEHDVAQREHEIKRLEVLADATRTFIALLVAQKRAALADDQLSLVERLAAAERAQVEAGQVAPYERSRAVAAVAEARLRAAEARREIQVLRQRLAAFWNADAVAFREVTGDLSRLPPVPALSNLLQRLETSPEFVRDAAEIDLRRSALALERARTVPDLTVSAGVRRYEDEDNYAFVVGVAIPIRIFNRGQGAVLEADLKQQQAELQLATARKRLTAAISENVEKLTATAAEIETIRGTLIPSSEESLSALREGYRLRRFPLSELLIAEQSLNALRDKLLTTLGTYHQSYSDLEQLLGGALEGQPASEPR